MTLNTRNKLLFIFTIFSGILCIGLLIIYLIHVISNKLITLSFFSLDNIIKLILEPSKTIPLLSTLILLIFVPTISYISLRIFEKTQAPEAIYFDVFILGVFFTSLQILIHIFSLENSLSLLHLTISKTAFAGQIAVLLSFLFSSIFSNDDQIQIAEKNFYIILIISFFLSNFIPLNLANKSENILTALGFSKQFTFLLPISILCTFFSFLFYNPKQGKKKNYAIPIAYLMLITGFFILCFSISFIFMVIGSILFFWGTLIYLRTIHDYYLYR